MKCVTEPHAGITRRGLMRLAGSAMLAGVAPRSWARAPALLQRTVPSSGESIPSLGMGTWITFNVGNSMPLRLQRLDVMRAFLELGGGMIDSSPMYGSAQDVIGFCLGRLEAPSAMLSATKVWTRGRDDGIAQMERSMRRWGVDTIDVMQVHNLVDWRTHLDTLADWKAAGRIRYVGITTSHGMRHDAFEDIMRSRHLDFVQFTYNVLDRRAEARLLPLAADRGIGVIVNRPFQGGRLFDKLAHRPLPDFAGEIDCETWAAFFLKFVISHPAVTCAIPATSRVDHMGENMRAGVGRQPDAPLRRRMVDYVSTL